jgi:hypothetical protein
LLLPLLDIVGNILLEREQDIRTSIYVWKKKITPIPPAKELIYALLCVLIVCIFKEIHNKVVEGRIMEARVLGLPVACTVE